MAEETKQYRRFRVTVAEDMANDGIFVPINQYEWSVEVAPPAPPPEPEPTYTPVQAWVKTESLNVRLEPNTAKPRDGYIVKGNEITVYAEDVDVDMLNFLADEYADEAYRTMQIQQEYAWVFSPLTRRFYARISATGTEYLTFSTPTSPELVRGHTLQLTGDIRLAESGSGMKLDGFTGFGANLREGIHFHDVEAIKNILREQKNKGVKHVRMYVHHRDVDWITTLARVRMWANFTESIGLGFVAVFDESIGLSNHYCDLFEDYHTQTSLRHLSIGWYSDAAYKMPAYFWRLEELAALLAEYNHTMLDLMNEPSIVQPAGINQTNFNHFLNAWKFLSERAWNAAGGKLPITVGVISVNFFPGSVQQFMAETPHLSTASVHLYNEMNQPSNFWAHQEMAKLDLSAAPLYGKSTWIGEFGVHQANPSRSGRCRDFINSMVIPYGVSQISYWNVQPVGSDIGVCDDFCISPFRADFGGMMSLFTEYDNYFGSL